MTEASDIEAWFDAAGARADDLRRVDALITAAAPGIDRQLVPMGAGAMLGYRLIPYRPRSARTTTRVPLIALAPQKRHLSVYVCAVVDGAYLAEPAPTGWARCPAARAASASPRSTRSTPPSSPPWCATPSPPRTPGDNAYVSA